MCLSHPLSITFYLTSFTKTRPTPDFKRLTNLEMRSKHPGIGANSKSSLRAFGQRSFSTLGRLRGLSRLSAWSFFVSHLWHWRLAPIRQMTRHPQEPGWVSLPTTSSWWVLVCQDVCHGQNMIYGFYMISMGSGLPHDEYVTPLLYTGGWSSPFVGKNVWTMAYVCTCVPILWAQPRFIESIPASFFKTTRQVVVNFNLRFVKSSLSASIFTTTPQLQQWISSIPKEVWFCA